MNQARPHFYDYDFASKSAEHLSEFQPHIAAAIRRGGTKSMSYGAIGEILDVLESGDGRHERASTQIDEDLIGGDAFRADADKPRGFESCMAFKGIHSLNKSET